MLACATSLMADGLSWTDPNQDTLCDKSKTFFGIGCSVARIHQVDGVIGGMTIYYAGALLVLYPRDSEADSVTVTIIYETSDHVKHTYHKEHIPIKVTEPSGQNNLTMRYCEADFEAAETGVTSMLSIDANEISPSGDIVFRHRFR